MAKRKISKSQEELLKQELKKLKPIEIKEAKEKPKTEEKEEAEESQLERSITERDFSRSSWFAPSASAPTLKGEEISGKTEEPENLEKQAAKITAPIIEERPQVEYVVRAVPKYEAGEYSVGRSYETFEAQKSEIERARSREMAVTGASERFARAPVLEQRRAMNLAAWEVEHPVTTAMSHAEMQASRAQHEGYIAEKKEKRERAKLPFEE